MGAQRSIQMLLPLKLGATGATSLQVFPEFETALPIQFAG
jgi:hypothetical protein